MIHLLRSYTDLGTVGVLKAYGAASFVTMEPVEWYIPEGDYTFQRCTYYGGDGVGGRTDYETYEVLHVPGHTELKVHIGNWVRQTEGCPLIGEFLGVLQGELAVIDSQVAHARFMLLMADQVADVIRIETRRQRR